MTGPLRSGVVGGACSARHPTGRCSCGRVARRACQGTFEAGEQVDDIGCFEDSVALPTDVALAQHSSGFETVDGFACSHLGSSDQSCGAVDGDHRDAWQEVEEQLDRRVRSDSTQLCPPSCIECLDPARVGLGVRTRSVCSGGERTQPSARTGGSLRTGRRTDVSKRGEPGDVVTRPGGEHETDRRYEARCEAAAAEDDMDERGRCGRCRRRTGGSSRTGRERSPLARGQDGHRR